MTDKELKKLSRAELLELLLIQTQETERLQAQLERVQQKIRDRYLHIQEAGNLADAVIAVNGVMEAAQAAASQYLENIARMEEETKKRCEKMLEEARAEASRIRSGAAVGDKRKLVNANSPVVRTPKPAAPAQARPASNEPKFPNEVDQLLEELQQMLGDQ